MIYHEQDDERILRRLFEEKGSTGVPLFLSTFINKIDAKGRVSVPAPFRSAINTHPFAGFIAFRSFHHPAIEGCTYGRMEQLSRSTDTLDVFSETREDLTATLFADAKELRFDTDGRVILPQVFLDYATLRDNAAFVGRGATFQIWEPSAFAQFEETARQRMKDAKATLKLAQSHREGVS